MRYFFKNDVSCKNSIHWNKSENPPFKGDDD
jgi:hypothetical protein